MNTTAYLLGTAALIPPSTTPVPVNVIRHSLSPEAVIGIVCAVSGTVVPFGVVFAKFAIKRYRGSLEPLLHVVPRLSRFADPYGL
jgi:hypothetical protein